MTRLGSRLGLSAREEYRSAKHSAYRGDTSALETMFDAILRPANPTRVFLIAAGIRGLHTDCG